MTKRDTPIDGELEEISIGDRMYRVIDDVTPDDTDDGWVVQVRTVRAVTKRTFSLDRPFSYCLQSHGRMSHGVVGRIMFASEAAAVRDFLDKATRGRDGARRPIPVPRSEIISEIIEVSAAP